MGISAAIAAGVGAVASVGGALITSGAAKSAAGTQAKAAKNAANMQMQQYQQTRSDLLPFASAGGSANSALSNMIGVNGTAAQKQALAAAGLPGLTFQPTQEQLEATPGYQFTLSQGLNSVQNGMTARGLGVSGAALKGAAGYATGLANNTLGLNAGIFQQNVANVLNPLQAQANLGENAAAQTGNIGQHAVAGAAGSLTSGAAAQAAGQVGSANALASGLNGLGNAATNYLLLSQLNGGGGSVGTGNWNT